MSGVVQGVGFRPFVHRLAQSLGISGFVLNRAGEVHIEVEASGDALDRFMQRLRAEAPPLSRVEAIHEGSAPVRGDRVFRILASVADASASPFVSPDAATCESCLSELFDASDRRFRYPFINCTDCGPRLTIVVDAPYDRERTTMRGFELCALCRAEYEDPSDRRFHAEPNACADCGPTLVFAAGDRRLAAERALEAAAAALHAGKLLAIKGIGGYHLACDAKNPAAVAELRRRKARDQKPFALMVPDIAAALALCEVSADERALLLSAERPIVLLQRRKGAGADVAPEVAPQSPLLGVMLPYTPLHHLLLADLGAPLVMTSGNVSHEPIAYLDDDARQRLSPIADGFLTHNRPIHLRCDDSVVRSSAAGALVLRRSRGAAPRALALDQEVSRPLLALGAQSNATFALARGRHAFVSHHLGDLEHYAAYRAYTEAIAHYQALFRVEPELLVHDRHPDYASTRVAQELAELRGLATLAVQHHHAHIASVMLEHGLHGRVIGVAFDGTGYGGDGEIWGGEFLSCERATSERLAYLRPVPMPGGERAVLEPWRMAVAYLLDAGESLELLTARCEKVALAAVAKLYERAAFCPASSGAGRLFDAVSALAGVCTHSSYDGQAAIELEWAAEGDDEGGSYDFDFARDAERWVVDTRPLIRGVARDLARGKSVRSVSRRFHRTVALLVLATCERLRSLHGLSRVVLGGGVFANAILVEELEASLPAAGFELFRPRAYPAGDGGLCLGQLAVAAALEGRG